MVNPKEHICYCCKDWVCTDDVLELSVNIRDFFGICQINKKDVKGGDWCINWRMRAWISYSQG